MTSRLLFLIQLLTARVEYLMVGAEYSSYSRTQRFSRAALKDCNKRDIMALLRYICDNDRVTLKDSVHQYLNQFKMLYSRANGERVDTNDGIDAYEV